MKKAKQKQAKKHVFGLQPLGDRVVIVEIEERLKSPSGIFIPETIKQDRGAKTGKVVAVGEGRYEDGKLVPVSVKAGDEVLFQWGDQITYLGTEYFIVREGEIMAIIG